MQQMQLISAAMGHQTSTIATTIQLISCRSKEMIVVINASVIRICVPFTWIIWTLACCHHGSKLTIDRCGLWIVDGALSNFNQAWIEGFSGSVPGLGLNVFFGAHPQSFYATCLPWAPGHAQWVWIAWKTGLFALAQKRKSGVFVLHSRKGVRERVCHLFRSETFLASPFLCQVQAGWP